MKQIIETTGSCKSCLFIADPENFCYKMDKYLDHDINTVHPDCPLPDAEQEFCEWEKKWFIDYVNVSGYSISCRDLQIRIVDIKNYKFCPNCGKPIKIKE